MSGKLTTAEKLARYREDRTVTERPERKWGDERRRAIATAMLAPTNLDRKRDVVTFTRKVMRARDLAHFLDSIATEADVQHVERLLGII
jgi:hypothetical protein